MEKVEKKINEILEKNLDSEKYSWFLFGSRADGTNKSNSDYDIGILGEKELDFRTFLKIKRELDENISYNIDVVDFKKVDKNFKDLALSKIKIWNKPINLTIS